MQSAFSVPRAASPGSPYPFGFFYRSFFPPYSPLRLPLVHVSVSCLIIATVYSPPFSPPHGFGCFSPSFVYPFPSFQFLCFVLIDRLEGPRSPFSFVCFSRKTIVLFRASLVCSFDFFGARPVRCLHFFCAGRI